MSGVHAVDVADAGSQHVHAQVGDHLALVGIGHFAAAHNAVLFAADGAYLGLHGDALLTGDADDLLGLFDVLVDGVVGAVEHDGGEPGLHGVQGALVRAVVQVQGHRHGDVQGLYHGLDHGGHGLEAAHVLAGALGHAEDHRGVALLGGLEDGLGPLQVVDVELADAYLPALALSSISFADTSMVIASRGVNFC